MVLPRPTLCRFALLPRLVWRPPERFHRSSAHVSRTRSCQNPTLPAIPELFDPNFLDVLIPPPENGGPRNPMIDALKAHTTKNRAFVHIDKGPLEEAFRLLNDYYAWGDKVGELLDKAWEEDPVRTLKIIWNLRSIPEGKHKGSYRRVKGKADHETFYRAFGWLYDNHPRTAITNLPLLVTPVCGKEGKLSHGYWKDLLNILALATVDELSNLHKPGAKFLHRLPDVQPRVCPPPRIKKLVVKARRAAVGGANHARIERKLADPNYRALFVAVARLFSERLLIDWGTRAKTAIFHLRQSGPRALLPRTTGTPTSPPLLPVLSFTMVPPLPSLPRWILTPLRAATHVTETYMSANRWADIPYNRVSKVCMKENEYRFFLRDPERFQQYLISIDKGRRRRPVDYETAETLQPYELIAELASLRAPYTMYPELLKHREALVEEDRRVIEERWQTVVQTLREAGTVENAISVLDVSGSMGVLGSLKYHRLYPYHRDPEYLPHVLHAMPLSLILAQLAKPPFDGFITFSQDPEFVKLDSGKGLWETLVNIGNAPWQLDVDLYAAFINVILPMAIKHKCVVGVEQWETERRSSSRGRCIRGRDKWEERWRRSWWEQRKRLKEAGYEVPKIVFWNLNEYPHSAHWIKAMKWQAPKVPEGVTMQGEFTPALLSAFLGGTKIVEKVKMKTVEEDMEETTRKYREEKRARPAWMDSCVERALRKECYDGLVVVD
ncbi:hypothetical protein FB45DRAFT_1013854 [Roridomyces roridus]|uniref:Uncharacterized protein n=1 Tax=Roridomyces roridus TaxID=1738132 RepID=A0AAD7AXX3_9AGAR|nr:hypothetical protein FB45DRAFT_1013854 [Roridomyces roridus]